ncbi:MAG: PPE family protein [Actinomycetota bacterium]|nr:PPE family protein [Actinomycetota bacterium]
MVSPVAALAPAAAPVWMALPPEVHSALLSSGPGPGPLLAAAGSWHSLSTEYASAAAELTAILAGVQGSSWEGPSAERYVAAHTPYLAWLAQQSANSAATAVQHETAAAAYSTALATMPTLPELALNHTTHTVLVATNFLGINTIPIALNEADYVRMWIQAATAMSTYQAVSGAALAATPTPTAAPFILTPGVGEAGRAGADVMASAAQAQAGESGSSMNIIDRIFDLLGPYGDLLELLFDPIINFLSDPIGNTIQLITDFLTNPAAALVTWGPFLFAVAYQAVSWIGASILYPSLLLLPLAAAALGIVLGVGAYLLERLPDAPADAPAEEPAPAPAQAQNRPEQGLPVAPPAPPAPSSAAPAANTVAGGAPASAAAPATAAAPFAPYAVVGRDPDGGLSPTVRDSTGAKAPSAGIPAAASGIAASAAERRKRRRKQKEDIKGRGYADAYMDYDDDPDAGPDADAPSAHEPAVAASERGAGPMGFSGTVGTGTTEAGGLTTLAGDTFGGGPKSPMLPGSWDPDADQTDPEDHHHNRKENP